MILTEQIFARVLAMAGETDEQQRQLLQALCAGAESALAAGLRQEASEAYRETLVTAASFYALAAYLEVDGSRAAERFTAGDVTVQRRSAAGGARALREQAERMLEPFRADRFSFRGV